jgi:hypothetical protein
MLDGELEDLCRWGDLRLGRLQNRIPPRQPQGETCLVGVEGPPLYLEVTDPGRLAAPPIRNQVRVLAFSVADRWLCRAQGLDLLVGVTAAELGVGGDSQMPGPGGGVFPFLAVGHGLGEGPDPVIWSPRRRLTRGKGPPAGA